MPNFYVQISFNYLSVFKENFFMKKVDMNTLGLNKQVSKKTVKFVQLFVKSRVVI